MTTPLLALLLSSPVPGPVKRKRVLLVDASPAKRELRAEAMRKLGMEVDCASDISEARSWWRADLYALVLINLENDLSHREKFCADIRAATPPQKLAFLVAKPEYLAESPNLPDPPGSKPNGDTELEGETELRALFQPHGDVERVNMVTDRETGRSRGFAFVEMANAGEAEKAIVALNGSELGGRTLTINEARQKNELPHSGGGGGRGRDDYRGHARQPREPRW